LSLAHGTEIVKRATTTRDAFLGGRLTVTQPATGFRAGLDSVLLGAAVSRGEGELLDLGAGAGTAALVALADHEALAATLAERDPELLALAAQNLAANGFAARARAIEVDITAPGATRTAAGSPSDHYAAVIANPPFFSDGTPATTRGAAARQMPPGSLDRWVKTAATHAAPGAEIIFIHAADQLPELLAAFDARFGAITILPLTPREAAPVHRVLIRGIKGSRARLTLLPSRALHETAGQTFRPEFEAIFRGAARLHW
jgi:tRNA1(Val) A37 N6-methylase TrmN6